MGKSIDTLHDAFERLSETPPDQRPEDLVRSLRYYLAATHPGTAPTRVQRWIDRAVELEDFVERLSRMPRENSRKRAAKSKQERSLADWVRYQRRIEEKLCDYQARRLELIEGFTWDPRSS